MFLFGLGGGGRGGRGRGRGGGGRKRPRINFNAFENLAFSQLMGPKKNTVKKTPKPRLSAPGQPVAGPSNAKNYDSEPEDETTFKGKVHGVLKKIKNTGKGGSEFAVAGHLTQVPNMPISIKDGGIMKFPMYEEETQRVIDAFEKSPYGMGTATVVNPNVRNSWQLDPSQFTISNPKWGKYMIEVLMPRIGKEMDIATPFTASLYKLLLYKTGSFFKIHRDSEKEKGMFATLVVQLPSKYTGGQLIVTHDNKRRTIDFSSTADPNSEFEMYYSAFYCDCEHEILPLTSGVRICLIYNLAIGKTGIEIPLAPRMTDIETQLSSLLSNWEINGPAKIVYAFSHRYTQKNFSFENLKSSDRSIAKTVMNVAKQNDVTVLMGIFEKESAGCSKQESDSEDFDSDDADCYCEKMYSLTDLKVLDEQGNKAYEFNSLSADYEKEIIPKNCFQHVSPYNKNSSYIGNAGVEVSLFYRGAALVLFPSENIVKVLMEDGETEKAEKLFLGEFQKSIAKERDAKLEAKLKKWAIHMSAKFTKGDSYIPGGITAVFPMLSAVVSFNDLTLLQDFLDRYTPINEDTLPLVVSQCKKFGWLSLSPQLTKMFKTLKYCQVALKLLKLVVEGELNQDKETVCRLIAQEVLALPKQAEGYSYLFYNPRTAEERQMSLEAVQADQNFLFDFCQTAKRINFNVLEYAKAKPINVVGPVLIKLCNEVNNTLTLDRYWVELGKHFLEKLEEIAAKVVVQSWKDTNYMSCGCKDCIAVYGFMKSEIISMGFKMGKARSRHIQMCLNNRNIREEYIPMGNQQTLVLTKLSQSQSAEAEEQKLAKEFIPKVKAILQNS